MNSQLHEVGLSCALGMLWALEPLFTFSAHLPAFGPPLRLPAWMPGAPGACRVLGPGDCEDEVGASGSLL